jgi:hypothetical protein
MTPICLPAGLAGAALWPLRPPVLQGLIGRDEEKDDRIRPSAFPLARRQDAGILQSWIRAAANGIISTALSVSRLLQCQWGVGVPCLTVRQSGHKSCQCGRRPDRAQPISESALISACSTRFRPSALDGADSDGGRGMRRRSASLCRGPWRSRGRHAQIVWSVCSTHAWLRVSAL